MGDARGAGTVALDGKGPVPCQGCGELLPGLPFLFALPVVMPFFFLFFFKGFFFSHPVHFHVALRHVCVPLAPQVLVGNVMLVHKASFLSAGL